MGKTETNHQMKVLILSYRMPFKCRDGGAMSVLKSIESALYSGAVVKVLAVNATRQWIEENEIDMPLAERTKFKYVPVNTDINWWPTLLNLFSKYDYFTRRFYSTAYVSKLKNILAKNQYDVIQLEHVCMAHYIEIIRSITETRIILKAQNVEHALVEQNSQRSANWLRKCYLKMQAIRLREFEQSACNRVDGIIALTENDAMVFRQMAPQQSIAVVPLYFETTSALEFKKSNKKPTAYHIGSMDWWPNQQGLQWFLKHIWPLVKTNSPKHFHFAGKKMPHQFSLFQNDSVHCDGEVDDAVAYHLSHDVMAVPLLSGSGIRLKIIEAMSQGKCVVSTNIGAQGLHCIHGEHIFIADGAADFAHALSIYLSDIELRLKLGSNAKAFVEENYSLDMISKKWNSFALGVIQK